MNVGDKVSFKAYATDTSEMVEKGYTLYQAGDELELVELIAPAEGGNPEEWTVRRTSDKLEASLFADEFSAQVVGQAELSLDTPEPKVEEQTEEPAPEQVTQPAKKSSTTKGVEKPALETANDDLTQLKGVGAKMAEKINAAGITSFAQLAGMSDEQLSDLDKEIKAIGAVTRNDWRGQAQQLMNPVSEQTEDTTPNVPATTQSTEVADTKPEAEVVERGSFVPENGLILHVDRLIAEQGALAAAQAVRRQADANDYLMGGLIRHIYENQVYADIGYEVDDRDKGFEQYVESELGIRYRKAMYLKDIHTYFTPYGEAFVSRGVAIGWSKMKEIAQVMKRDDFSEDQAMPLLEYAEKHTRNELQAHIKTEYVAAGEENTTDPKTKKTTLTLQFWADEYNVAEGTLNACIAKHGLKDKNEAANVVFQEWSTVLNDKNSVPLDAAIANIESRYGVKLTVEKTV